MLKHTITRLGLIALTLVLGGASCISLSGSGTEGPLGMFVSTDKGETWQSISVLPTAQGAQPLSNVAVYRIVSDPQDAKALYWLSREHGFFFSYNEGRSWQRPEQGPLMSGFVYSIAVHPQDKCTLYASNGRLVLKSVDCSRSWQEVYRESRTDILVKSLVFNPFRPQQAFMALSGGDVLQTLDGGNSWNVMYRFRVPVEQFVADPATENLLYVISKRHGLYRSVDGGQSWVALADSFDDFSDALEYRRFAMDSQQRLYWVSTYGLLTSENRGDTWRSVPLITPPGSAQIYSFAVNPNNSQELYYTATINNRSTFYKSVDGGRTWITKKLPSGQLPTALHVHPENGDIVYLGFTEPPKQ